MILYLSSGVEKEYFEECQKKGYIKGGYQAQKFNQMMIEGLAAQKKLVAISNIPFCSKLQKKVPEKVILHDSITYISLGNNRGILHKILNIVCMVKYGKRVCKENRVAAIVCDSINPLASLTSRILSRAYRIPQIAIVTDVPIIMNEGNKTFFTILADFLIKRYNGYVLLTEAMNSLVNPLNKPYIIMEGLCDVNEGQESEIVTKENVCLYTGSLVPETGIENLISGFKEIKIDNYQLHIYGNGPLSEKLSKNDKYVKYCGAVTNREVVMYQKQATLLINPRPINLTYTEFSFPSKIMEYMVSGTPVLSTKLPGIPVEYAPYMYWIEDDSPKGIGEAIERVLKIPEDIRNQKGHCARRFVLEQKNNIYQTKRVLDLIEEIRK